MVNRAFFTSIEFIEVTIDMSKANEMSQHLFVVRYLSRLKQNEGDVKRSEVRRRINTP